VDVVDKDYKSAAEKGFNVLASFIFGNNISKEKTSYLTL